MGHAEGKDDCYEYIRSHILQALKSMEKHGGIVGEDKRVRGQREEHILPQGVGNVILALTRVRLMEDPLAQEEQKDSTGEGIGKSLPESLSNSYSALVPQKHAQMEDSQSQPEGKD
jgi:hypothetical protein